MYNPIEDAELRRNQIIAQRDQASSAANFNRPFITGYLQAPLTPAQVRSGRTGIAFLLALPWLAGLAVAFAHAMQRHHVPAMPLGIPTMIAILAVALGLLVTTRYKLSWMALSLAAATYAAFNL